jgi:hypothetical protein
MRLISTIQTVGALPDLSKLTQPENNPEFPLGKDGIPLDAFTFNRESYDRAYYNTTRELKNYTDLMKVSRLYEDAKQQYESSYKMVTASRFSDSLKSNMLSNNLGAFQATKDWYSALNTKARIASENQFYKNIASDVKYYRNKLGLGTAPAIPDSAPITPQIPASNAAPGTVAVPTTSAVATDTAPGKTSPLTIAAIGFAALKLLAII